ncbi:unnamed protein product [Rotaria sp. Silwood2]|nr:unnamed protein product [Rotaria sp. Silwood2]CAF4154054.1 unnamed protein product [Rotaria sp. Silwood2]
MDLILLLLTEQQSQQTTANVEKTTSEHRFVFDTQKFPKVFRDILTTIDVIQALTDRKKQTPFPETFILQVNESQNQNLRLTRDDIEKLKNHFDGTADQQLMNFMNKELFANNSINDFLQRLPEELVPNATFYKNYSSLSNIPATDIRTRVKLLYQCGTLVEKVVPVLDFSLSQKQSMLLDRIKTAKTYLSYPTKFRWLQETLSKTDTEYSGSMPQVQFDTVKASATSNKQENTMFSQAFEQLHENAQTTFRRRCDHLWTAQYIGMHSTDGGGPYRDSITHICSNICSTRLPLFILCPNGRTNSGLNRDRWIPNVFPPNKPISNRLKNQYRFVGQLMGIAIRNKHYMNFNFPQLLWKQLVGDKVTMEDIEAIDMHSFTVINEMEQNMKQNRSIDNDTDIDYLFSSIMNELRFDIVSSASQTYELVPGGSEIPITANNFREYCTHYREYRLNEFSQQIEFIRQGLYSVVPGYYLNLFTASELEESVCGKGEIDIEILKQNTHYDGSLNENSPHIQRFWNVLSEMFNEEQKKQFLIFAWGRSTLPVRDEDFTTKFGINEYDLSSGEVDQALPRSHTCFFTIDLPEYSTTEIMYERLNYAITNCSSIDGDGNMNEIPEQMHVDSDSDD